MAIQHCQQPPAQAGLLAADRFSHGENALSKKSFLRCFDNGGQTADRYTVVFMKEPERNGCYAALGMSERPFHPLGYGMSCAAVPGRHLGRAIEFNNLPTDCQRLVKQYLSPLHCNLTASKSIKSNEANCAA
ncbi:hypothetical protein ACMYR3_17060 (plasmid) [Ampullimonas aquatilis]|uniref:hypothetical protein n=1 Tax=Ampullimonas aquatilis TaxID=1341549 RepID=UPI003C720DFD